MLSLSRNCLHFASPLPSICISLGQSLASEGLLTSWHISRSQTVQPSQAAKLNHECPKPTREPPSFTGFLWRAGEEERSCRCNSLGKAWRYSLTFFELNNPKDTDLDLPLDHSHLSSLSVSTDRRCSLTTGCRHGSSQTGADLSFYSLLLCSLYSSNTRVTKEKGTFAFAFTQDYLLWKRFSNNSQITTAK